MRGNCGNLQLAPGDASFVDSFESFRTKDTFYVGRMVRTVTMWISCELSACDIRLLSRLINVQFFFFNFILGLI